MHINMKNYSFLHYVAIYSNLQVYSFEIVLLKSAIVYAWEI